MQAIADWLAEPPRRIVISRQAVHQWLRARIRKLSKLNADFAGTGISAPFHKESAFPEGPPMRQTRELPTARSPPPQAPTSSSLARDPTDMSDFLVSEADLSRAQNPLLTK
jgi:hypothetical protein